MGTSAEDEERERIRKAHENVERWKEKYTGTGGFSGGVRIVTQTNTGIRSDFKQTFGDPKTAQKIIERAPLTVGATGGTAVSDVVKPRVIKQPPPWWQRIGEFFLGKAKP